MLKILIKENKKTEKDLEESGYEFNIQNTGRTLNIVVKHKNILIGNIGCSTIDLHEESGRRLGDEYRSCLSVDTINVSPAYRRKGIGTALYQKAAKAAKDKKINFFISSLGTRSPDSEGFWKKQLENGRAIYDSELEVYILDLKKDIIDLSEKIKL